MTISRATLMDNVWELAAVTATQMTRGELRAMSMEQLATARNLLEVIKSSQAIAKKCNDDFVVLLASVGKSV